MPKTTSESLTGTTNEIRSAPEQPNILQLLLLVVGNGRDLVIRVLGDGVLGRALDLGEELLGVLRVALEQVVGDHALRGLAEPLEEGEVAELVGAEDLEHLDGLVADVLDKVAHVARDDADVAGHVVEGAGGALGGEDGDSRAAADEEVPFVGVGVPVHLAQGAGLDDGVGGGHGLGDGEVLGVGDAHLTARGDDGLLGEHLVGEVVLGLLDVLAGGPLVIDGAWVGALEDVLLALGQVGEDLWGEVEVLGDDRLGRVGWMIHKLADGQADNMLVKGQNLPSQSVRMKVLSSEKRPSSNTSRNSVPLGLRPCKLWGTPLGKYHRSPFSRSSMKLPPS